MDTTPATLDLLQAVQVYFQGEKLEALIFILPMGLASLVFGAWLLSDGASAFSRGVALPCLVLGLVLTLVGATVGYRTPRQVATLEASLRSAPAVTLEAEIARMSQVNAAWKYYLVAWAGFGVTGLLLRFAARADFLQGLGVALVFFAGVGLLVDGFAERRTHPYTAALDASAAARP